MSLLNKNFTLGNLNGTIYDFENINDELPMHTHDESTVHISIVARGKFLIYNDNWEKEFSAGAFLDWDPGVYHAFRSLEPNSRLINIVKS